MNTITTEDIQRYVRIVLHVLAGSLAGHGFSEAGSLVTASTGIIVEAVTLAWSIYGMRVNAKISEMNKLAKVPETPVKGIITTNTVEGRALASSLQGPIEVAGTAGASRIANAA